MNKKRIKNILVIAGIVGLIIALVLTGNIRVEKPANTDVDSESIKEPYDSLYVDEDDIDLEVEEELQDEEDFEVEEDLEKPRKELTEEEELILYLNQFALLNSTETNVLENKHNFLLATTNLIFNIDQDKYYKLVDEKDGIDNYIKSFYYEKKVDALIKNLRSITSSDDDFNGDLYSYDSKGRKYVFTDSFSEAGNPMAKVTKIDSLKKENGIYTITFTYDYGDDDLFYMRDENPEEYEQKYDGYITPHRRTIKLKKNKDTKYSKYKIINLGYATQLGDKDDKIKIIYNEKIVDGFGRTIKSLIINDKDVTKKILPYNNKYNLNAYIKEEKDFVILNIYVASAISYTTSYSPFYNLYIFDYSGNLLFDITTNDENNFVYYGEYKYNQDSRSVQFVEIRECHLDSYVIPELGVNNETYSNYYTTGDLEKLGKEKYGKINWGIVYEISYLPTGKFSDLKVNREIKFSNKEIETDVCPSAFISYNILN